MNLSTIIILNTADYGAFIAKLNHRHSVSPEHNMW